MIETKGKDILHIIKNTIISIAVGLFISPLASFLLGFIIDLISYIEIIFARFDSQILINPPGYSPGWIIFGSIIAKTVLPFIIAYNVLNIFKYNVYTWFPILTFILTSLCFVFYHVLLFLDSLSFAG